MDLESKLKVLTEGAKYDVSCSSSGSTTGSKKGHLGNASLGGICHSFTQDGRCVSLLKILQSNFCEYDCVYCINRRSNDIERARLTSEEICEIVMNFYRRNYIEGLFLSSAVDKSPNHMMRQLTKTVELLREKYKFRGYIHLKAIPGADNQLIDYASKFVDRMSVNIEFPSENSLKILAPQKKKDAIVSPMKMLANTYETQKLEKRKKLKIPAGQTTQMIVGASQETDGQILRLSQALYENLSMKRVYYSNYVPINKNSSLLPVVHPDLRRENRLYQADWLLRFYGFKADELLPEDYNFDLSLDPKSNWALNNYDKFPLEINKAPYEMLLRVPGIGVRNAFRIDKARKHSKLSFEDLKKMRIVMNRAKYFITVNGKFYGNVENPYDIKQILNGSLIPLSNGYSQMTFFNEIDNYSVDTGEF